MHKIATRATTRQRIGSRPDSGDDSGPLLAEFRIGKCVRSCWRLWTEKCGAKRAKNKKWVGHSEKSDGDNGSRKESESDRSEWRRGERDERC